MQTLWQDFRYASRRLRRSPGFALTAILTLALGLGATTAMLAIVDSVLVRPLPLPHADRIVNVARMVKGQQSNFAYKDFLALQAGVKSFAAIAANGSLPTPITTGEGTRMVVEVTVSPGFFSVAGTPARMGRVLTEADVHAPVAVANDSFWKSTLHSDPRAVGSTVKIAGTVVTIVGVMPPEFAFPDVRKSGTLYTPLTVNASGEDRHGLTTDVNVEARLRPGVSMATALAEARAVYAHNRDENTEDRGVLFLRSFHEVVTREGQPAIYALVSACALLLLIGCANSANLQIARAVTRTGEMSVRAALGASRGHLLRQIVTESVVVSLLGAALGLLLAVAAVAWAQHAYQLVFARFDELELHPEVFCACVLLAILAGVLAALAPALGVLRNTGGLPISHATRITRRSRLSSSLVAIEIALTCTLLVTSGLLIRTFRALEEVPLGFDPHRVTAITLMPVNPQEDVGALVQTYNRLLDQLSSLPGVEAATTQTSLPFSKFTLSYTSDFEIAGRPRPKNNTLSLSLISAGYNRALGVRVLQGRGFTLADTAGSQPVCLVNEIFVRQFLGGGRAVGKVVTFPKESDDAEDTRPITIPLTIVGVLPDEIGGRNLREQPGPTLFYPYRQFAAGKSSQLRFAFGIAPQFAVRSTLPQATLENEIRAALRSGAPDMAEMEIAPLEANIAASLTQQKLALRLATAFGALSLLLATVGVYGVLAYWVAQRTREIGVRMALGSTRQQAMGLVLRQAAAMVAAGLCFGLVCAWPAGRAVRSFLFGVAPLDPLALATAALVLLVVCFSAAAFPAYRATQVDPIEALRSE